MQHRNFFREVICVLYLHQHHYHSVHCVLLKVNHFVSLVSCPKMPSLFKFKNKHYGIFLFVVGGTNKEICRPPLGGRTESWHGVLVNLVLFSREPIDRLASCCALYFAPLQMFEALLQYIIVLRTYRRHQYSFGKKNTSMITTLVVVKY